MARAARSGCEIVLPKDVVIANALRRGRGLAGLPGHGGARRRAHSRFRSRERRHAQAAPTTVHTVLWNGPLGAFETTPFGEGTFALAREVASLTKEGKLVSVAGGGDTVRALKEAGAASGFTYVSTAGGAFLEWLGGHALPGVAALARSGARH